MKIFVPFNIFTENEENESSLSFGDFQYDNITDEHISFYLKQDLRSVNLREEWNSKDNFLDDNFHAKRIAALVKLIEAGLELDPVIMELSEYNKNQNYVNDGHHRIRALKFLKRKGFWADIGGFEFLMEEFESICSKA